MTAGRRAPQHDPTGERTADQSTQTAGGLHEDADVEGIRPSPGADVVRDVDDTAYRNDEDLYATPRRYDSDDNDDERVMPPNASSRKPKL